MPDGDGAGIGRRLGAGTRYYNVTDHQNSVVGMFSKPGTYYGGYSYSPYGEQRAISSDPEVNKNNLRYISGYYDTASGLYKLGARYYDPTIGRFTQFDPSGQEANSYSYAACNPIGASDPTGLSCGGSIFSLTMAGIGLVASGVGVIAGTPTLVLGAVAAVGFAASAAGVVYSVGDMINSC